MLINAELLLQYTNAVGDGLLNTHGDLSQRDAPWTC